MFKLYFLGFLKHSSIADNNYLEYQADVTSAFANLPEDCVEHLYQFYIKDFSIFKYPKNLEDLIKESQKDKKAEAYDEVLNEGMLNIY